jgi:hypothetical protein
VGLLLCVTACAVAVGWLTRGSISRLAGLPLRGWPLALAAALALVVGVAFGTAAAIAGFIVAAACLLVLLGRNRAVEGVPLLAAGLLLNATVILANGAMPVSLYAEFRAGIDNDAFLRANSGAHEVADKHTRLSPLGDVVPVPLPLRPETASVGDILIVAGVGLLIVAGMHRRTEEE